MARAQFEMVPPMRTSMGPTSVSSPGTMTSWERSWGVKSTQTCPATWIETTVYLLARDLCSIIECKSRIG